MPTQYIVTDEELTAVANAIRTKGGTSAQLEFPTEFVSAVQAISTSGGSGNGKPYPDASRWNAGTYTSLIYTDLTVPQGSMWLIMCSSNGVDIQSYIGCTMLYECNNNGNRIGIAIVTSENDLTNGVGFTVAESAYLELKATRYIGIVSASVKGTPVRTGMTAGNNNIYSVSIPINEEFIAICTNNYANYSNDFNEVWGVIGIGVTLEVPMRSGSLYPNWGGSQSFTEFFNFTTSGGTAKFIPPANANRPDNYFAIIILSVVYA